MSFTGMHLGREMFVEGNDEQIIELSIFFLFSTAYILSMAIERKTWFIIRGSPYFWLLY